MDLMEGSTLRTPPDQRHVGVETAGAMTGLSPWTWRRWAYEGKISSVKAGRRLLIPVSEIERVMQEGTRPAREAP